MKDLAEKIYLSPAPSPVALDSVPSEVILLLLFIYCLLLLPLGFGGCIGSLFCGVFLGVQSRLAIILLRKIELVTLL